MPLVEFVGDSVSDDGNVAVSTGRLINCYREAVLGGGRTQHVLQTVLGQTLLDDLGAATTRATGTGDGKNWLAGDGKLFELAGAGTLTERGLIADDASTVISGNYSDVTITAGNLYYIWDGVAISQPTTKTFADVSSHFYIGGYTVLLEAAGKRFQWSDLGDASTLDALNFSSADKVDDDLVRGFEVQGVALLMCETSSEIWQITGSANTEAFAFVQSWNRGLRAHNLAVKFDDSLFWVGDDDNVYIGFGPGATDITTPAINTSLTNNDPTHCFYYEDRGHKFCVLRFSDRPAWVYDVKMREWHERAEGANNGAWRALTAIEGDTWQTANTVGEVYSLTRANMDLNQPLRRTAISRPVYFGDEFRVSRLEISARVGEVMINDIATFGLATDEPGVALKVDTGFGLLVDSTDGSEREGSISLMVSRDGGRTYGAAKPRGIGLKGDYRQRMEWRSLGWQQQFSAMVYIDETADIQINSTAVLELA